MEKQIAARFNVLPSRQKIMLASWIFDNDELKYEPFIAPLDFDPDAQELNIIKVFDEYQSENKKYIFSVGNSTETVLPAISGRSYAYKQNNDSYVVIANGTITWDIGSTKRHVVVIDEAQTISIESNDTEFWIHIVSKCTFPSFSFYNRTRVRYITCSDINDILNIQSQSFEYCYISGKLTIPDAITSIPNYAFDYSNITSVEFNNLEIIGSYSLSFCKITYINLNNNINTVENAAFAYCPINILEIGSQQINFGSYVFYDCPLTSIINHAITPQNINSNTFYSIDKSIPLHVPIGSLSAYQSAAGWSEFTNIIEDL